MTTRYLILNPVFIRPAESLSPSSPFFEVFGSQIRQNLRFSSAAAVATVHPSGLSAEERIRESCAGTSYIFVREGYDHRQMLLLGNPCVDKSSLACGDQMRDVTCVAVGRDAVRAPVVDDQK